MDIQSKGPWTSSQTPMGRTDPASPRDVPQERQTDLMLLSSAVRTFAHSAASVIGRSLTPSPACAPFRKAPRARNAAREPGITQPRPQPDRDGTKPFERRSVVRFSIADSRKGIHSPFYRASCRDSPPDRSSASGRLKSLRLAVRCGSQGLRRWLRARSFSRPRPPWSNEAQTPADCGRPITTIDWPTNLDPGWAAIDAQGATIRNCCVRGFAEHTRRADQSRCHDCEREDGNQGLAVLGFLLRYFDVGRLWISGPRSCPRSHKCMYAAQRPAVCEALHSRA